MTQTLRVALEIARKLARVPSFLAEIGRISIISQVFKSKPARYSAQYNNFLAKLLARDINPRRIVLEFRFEGRLEFDRLGHRLEASDALASNYRGYGRMQRVQVFLKTPISKKEKEKKKNSKRNRLEGEDGRGEKGGEKHAFLPSFLLLLFRPGYRPPLGLAPAVSPTQVSSECLRPRPGSRFQRINNWGRLQPPLKTYTYPSWTSNPRFEERTNLLKKNLEKRRDSGPRGMDRVVLEDS